MAVRRTDAHFDGEDVGFEQTCRVVPDPPLVEGVVLHLILQFLVSKDPSHYTRCLRSSRRRHSRCQRGCRQWQQRLQREMTLAVDIDMFLLGSIQYRTCTD